MELSDDDGDRGEIAFDDVIPKPGPEIFIKRLKGSEKLHCTIYADAIRGVWYHWMNGRSQPHYVDEKKCPGCIRCMGKKWKGYLHCYASEMKQEIFLELTPAAGIALTSQLGRKIGLRGFVIFVQRTKGDNGRLQIRIEGTQVDPAKLPSEKNPQPSITKLWEIAESRAEQWMPPGINGKAAENVENPVE